MTERPVLEIKRVFEATPAEIFESWLVRDEWQAWIGPEGIHCDVTHFEPRVGGRYRLVMHLPSGETIRIVGEFVAIERDVSFAFTWGGEDSDQTTLVSVVLRAVDADHTELTLRHEQLPDDQLDSHRGGWNSALNKLERHLA